VLSKFPLVVMDVFGEVIRVTQIQGLGKRCYHLGIRFLDLMESDREKLIACVFRRQREVIRGRINEGSGPGLITTSGGS
jgi:hypothetical protein